jgi:hypothetical protein
MNDIVTQNDWGSGSQGNVSRATSLPGTRAMPMDRRIQLRDRLALGEQPFYYHFAGDSSYLPSRYTLKKMQLIIIPGEDRQAEVDVDLTTVWPTLWLSRDLQIATRNQHDVTVITRAVGFTPLMLSSRCLFTTTPLPTVMSHGVSDTPRADRSI